MNKKTRSGFTLPEVLLATVLSVMVFFALGTVLTRSFSIWYSGMAKWKLATHARVARIRLLDGGFGKGTGMLCATNYTVYSGSGIQYYSAGGALSWAFERDGDLVLYNQSASPRFVYGQSIKNYDPGGNEPDVKIGGFDAEIKEGGTVLEMTYTLYLSAGGKTNEQSQTVRTVLLNSN